MTIKEFYDGIGGGYEEVLERFQSEEVITMLLNMFLEDPSYNLLVESFEKGDYDEAFRGAHSLKGTASNVALTKLIGPATSITEALRDKNIDDAEAILPVVKMCYNDVTKRLAELLQG